MRVLVSHQQWSKNSLHKWQLTNANNNNNNNNKNNKLCAWRHKMLPPLSSPVGAQAPRAPPSRRNVAVLSHAEYVPTLTAAATL